MEKKKRAVEVNEDICHAEAQVQKHVAFWPGWTTVDRIAQETFASRVQMPQDGSYFWL